MFEFEKVSERLMQLDGWEDSGVGFHKMPLSVLEKKISVEISPHNMNLIVGDYLIFRKRYGEGQIIYWYKHIYIKSKSAVLFIMNG